MKDVSTLAPPTESELRMMVDNIPNIAWVAAPDGYAYWFNKQWYEYTGTTPDEVTGWGLQAIQDPEKLPEVTKHWHASIKSGKPLEMTLPLRGADSIFRQFLVRILPLKDESGKVQYWFGTGTDVSEQMKAEEALAESEERFRATFDHAAVGITHTAVSGKLLLVNNKFAEITGYTKDELTKLTFQEITYPDDLETDLQHLRMMLDRKIDNYTMEKRYVKKEGSPVWVRLNVSAMRNPDHSVKYFIAIVEDITEAKKAHEIRQRLADVSRERNELLQINKSKDEFIGIASHQLRTPATAVKQYLGLVLDDFAGPLNDDQTRYIQTAYNNNERQLRLVSDLLQAARVNAATYKPERQQYDISRLTREVIQDLEPIITQKQQHILTQGLDIQARPAVDATEIRLALSNLIENASKYSPEGATITVSLKKTNKSVVITVKDRGIGIAKEDLEKIFDKFTRLDNDYTHAIPGTGLGLYLVRKIVDVHNGTLSVQSVPKQGSEFSITLPL